MSEPRIGRFLVASLHQAIAELLPDRLEFYENWLSVTGLREGTIGLAPLHAVLSFLRGEGEVYAQVVARAGDYAAQWTVNGLPALERRVLRTLPLRLRTRAALRTARGLVSATYPGSRAIVRMRKEDRLDRSARLAVLRSARSIGAAALRVLRRGDLPRPAALRRARRSADGRLPRRRRRAGLFDVGDRPAGHGRGVGGGVTGTMMRVFAPATAPLLLTLGVADTPAQGTPAQSPDRPASSSSLSRTPSAKPG